MSEMKNCDRCKGSGGYEYLISMHDDETAWTECTKCNGRGTINQMTEDEERDYKENNF